MKRIHLSKNDYFVKYIVYIVPFQIHEGDHIDIVESGADLNNKNANIKVQRVKVVKYSEKKTKSGKPITVVRVWKRPFEIAINEVSY